MSRNVLGPEIAFLESGEFRILLDCTEKCSVGECNYAAKAIKINLINALARRVIQLYARIIRPAITRHGVPIKELFNYYRERCRHVSREEMRLIAIYLLKPNSHCETPPSPERAWAERTIKKIKFCTIKNQKRWTIRGQKNDTIIINLARIIAEIFIHEMAHAQNPKKSELAIIRIEQRRLRELTPRQTSRLARRVIEASICKRSHRYIKKLILNGSCLSYRQNKIAPSH